MSAYSEFFLNTPSNIVQLDLLEISHPDFSQVYRIVRNHTQGVTVTLEDDTEATFDYYPVLISAIGAREDLDFGIQVQLGDLGEILPQEIDRVAAADGFGTKPTVKYRTYRSDDLTAPLLGPITLEMAAVGHEREGVAFEAAAPALNLNRTGEIYSLDRFPSLRGFL